MPNPTFTKVMYYTAHILVAAIIGVPMMVAMYFYLLWSVPGLTDKVDARRAKAKERAENMDNRAIQIVVRENKCPECRVDQRCVACQLEFDMQAAGYN